MIAAEAMIRRCNLFRAFRFTSPTLYIPIIKQEPYQNLLKQVKRKVKCPGSANWADTGIRATYIMIK
jgi:hypothetical protein